MRCDALDNERISFCKVFVYGHVWCRVANVILANNLVGLRMGEMYESCNQLPELS